MTAFHPAPPNPFLRKMEQGQRALGTFLFSPDPAHVEVVAAAGFDLAVVDLEHAPLHIGDVVNHVRAAQAVGISCWVRVGHAQPSEMGRLLDAGVQGVILPHFGVDPQATKAALDAMRYAPAGNRGTCTGTRALSHGLADFAAYAERSNRDVVAIGLVEDAAVLDRIDEVLAEHKLDAVFPGGPGDLATSMGLHGQGNHPRVLEAAATIIRAAKRVPGLKVGMYITDPDKAMMFADLGVDFFICSIDYRIMARAYQQLHGSLCDALGSMY